MNNPLVSIIVPIYNVEQYLEKCLISIINQTYTKIEIILVDDGSTDSSPEICKSIAKIDSRVVVIHKENGGLSDARNCGTLNAKGDYIYYLDGDDWIESGAIAYLVETSTVYNADVVQGGFYYHYDNYLLLDTKIKEIVSLNKTEAIRELILQDVIKNFAWGKLYRADIVKKYLFEKGRYFEDSFWAHNIINEVDKYLIHPIPTYHYIQRGSSISGGFSIKNIDLLIGTSTRLAFINKHYKELRGVANREFCKLAYSMLTCALHLPKQDRENIYLRVKEIVNKNLDYIPLKLKISQSTPNILYIFNLVDRVINRFSGLFKDVRFKRIDNTI